MLKNTWSLEVLLSGLPGIKLEMDGINGSGAMNMALEIDISKTGNVSLNINAWRDSLWTLMVSAKVVLQDVLNAMG